MIFKPLFVSQPLSQPHEMVKALLPLRRLGQTFSKDREQGSLEPTPFLVPGAAFESAPGVLQTPALPHKLPQARGRHQHPPVGAGPRPH